MAKALLKGATMKMLLSRTRLISGNTLLGTLVITGVLGFLLATYLTLVQRQFAVNFRSQAWNAAVPVIEAGIEDALTHLNTHGKTNLACDGWQLVNGAYIMERNLGDNFYSVSIGNYEGHGNPIISSKGYVTMQLLTKASSPFVFATTTVVPGTRSYLVRGVKVGTRNSGLFTKAMVAKAKVVVSGNVLTDSYNSSSSTASTDGRYDPAKSLGNGDIASNGQLIKQISTSGSVEVYGHVSTGPGGTVGLSGTVSVGSKDWVSSGTKGVEPGWFRDDMNVSFPDALLPTQARFAPSGGKVDGKDYEYILEDGNYELSSLSLSGMEEVLIKGFANLYVSGNISLSGQAKLKVVNGGTLRLFVGGATASLSGQGVANETGYATNFVYYGLPTNTRLDLSGGSGFTGIIYAPQAALKVSGGSVLCGATISDTIAATGGFQFHYDESLGSFDSAGFIVTSWNEMSPSEVGDTVVALAPPTE